MLVPLSLTVTVPWAAPATTLWPSTGTGTGTGRRSRLDDRLRERGRDPIGPTSEPDGVVNVRSAPRVVSVPLVATKR